MNQILDSNGNPVASEPEKQEAKETPKVPKEIAKLIKAFNNRRQAYFLIYLQDSKLVTSTNINTQDNQKTSEFLQASILNHYENL